MWEISLTVKIEESKLNLFSYQRFPEQTKKLKRPNLFEPERGKARFCLGGIPSQGWKTWIWQVLCDQL